MELGRGNGEVGRLAQSGPEDAVCESFAVGARIKEKYPFRGRDSSPQTSTLLNP
jgi:hypothetical protein